MEEMMDMKMAKMQEDLEKTFDELWDKRKLTVLQDTKVLIETKMKSSSEIQADEKVQHYIATTGEAVMNDLMSTKKQDTVISVTEATKEAAGKITQKFQSAATLKREQLLRELEGKESKVIKQIAQKRDGVMHEIEVAVETIGEESSKYMAQISIEGDKALASISDNRDMALGDINEEVAQAVNEIEHATEQNRVKLVNIADSDIDNASPNKRTDVKTSPSTYVTPSKASGGKHPMFIDVDETNLNVAPTMENKRYNRHMSHNGSSSKEDKTWNTLWSVNSFHKEFKAKLKSENNILSFYQQLCVQSPQYGIYVRKLEDIQPNEDLCPREFDRDARNNMARTIYQKLQDDNCVSISYEKAQQSILQYSSTSDGYKVLAQLLRFVHPNLQQMTSKTYEVPTLSKSRGNLYKYGDKVTNYVLNQRICNRRYNEVEKSIMFLNNLDTIKYSEAKQRALAEIRQIETGMMQGGQMDPNLTLESLPTTIEQYHMQIFGNKEEDKRSHQTFGNSFIRTMRADDSVCTSIDSDDDVVPMVRAFVRNRDPKRQYNARRYDNRRRDNDQRYDNCRKDNDTRNQCQACDRWGCSEKKCSFVARVHLAINFIKEHTSSAAKLAEEYLRINSKRTKMSTIRTLAAMDQNLHEQCLQDGDEILQEYDVSIPMEEVDFEQE